MCDYLNAQEWKRFHVKLLTESFITLDLSIVQGLEVAAIQSFTSQLVLKIFIVFDNIFKKYFGKMIKFEG